MRKERKMEITVQQISELLEQSKGRNPRVTREKLQAFLLNPDAFPRAIIYPVVVDYGKSVDEMVLVGHYDQKNNDINSWSFPIEGKGTVIVNLELVYFSKSVNSLDVWDYLEKNGMRPAKVEELLAFGATYPEIQRGFPIICLGSYLVGHEEDHGFPYLFKDGSGRNLDISWFVFGWDVNCRFLAVRE